MVIIRLLLPKRIARLEYGHQDRVMVMFLAAILALPPVQGRGLLHHTVVLQFNLTQARTSTALDLALMDRISLRLLVRQGRATLIQRRRGQECQTCLRTTTMLVMWVPMIDCLHSTCHQVHRRLGMVHRVHLSLRCMLDRRRLSGRRLGRTVHRVALWEDSHRMDHRMACL